MTTTHRKMRRPKARTRKGSGWAAFWNLCSTLTRAWQQGRTATSTRPRPQHAPGGAGSGPRAGRPGGLGSPGAQSGRPLVDVERDNAWLDSRLAGDHSHGIGAVDPDGPEGSDPSLTVEAAGCDTGGGAE